jgi:hypothetical protein
MTEGNNRPFKICWKCCCSCCCRAGRVEGCRLGSGGNGRGDAGLLLRVFPGLHIFFFFFYLFSQCHLCVSGPKELTNSRGEQQFLNIQGNGRLERRHREKTVEKKKKENNRKKKEKELRLFMTDGPFCRRCVTSCVIISQSSPFVWGRYSRLLLSPSRTLCVCVCGVRQRAWRHAPLYAGRLSTVGLRRINSDCLYTVYFFSLSLFHLE